MSDAAKGQMMDVILAMLESEQHRDVRSADGSGAVPRNLARAAGQPAPPPGRSIQYTRPGPARLHRHTLQGAVFLSSGLEQDNTLHYQDMATSRMRYAVAVLSPYCKLFFTDARTG